jgi:excisionase family DNA binding protein
MTEPLMTPHDVAEYLGVPEKTLYVWRWKGVGPPARKVGKHLRWKRADVERWLDKQSMGAEVRAG